MSKKAWMILRRILSGKTARIYSPLASIVLIVPIVILLTAIFFYPIGKLLLSSVWAPNFTVVHYKRLFIEPLYFKILLRTIRIAFFISLFTVILGYPVAYLMAELKGWKASLIAACVIMPLWTSVLVRSYAWTVLLQRNGIINTWLKNLGIIQQPLEMMYTEGAVLLAMTHVLLPFMILPIYSTLIGIPRDLVLAAQNLGAGSIAAFRYVIFPLSLPGVAAGSVMVFILALGFFITPALVGGPRTLMISTLIGQQATELLNWPFAGALAGLLLAVTIVLVLLFNRTLRLHRRIEYGA